MSAQGSCTHVRTHAAKGANAKSRRLVAGRVALIHEQVLVGEVLARALQQHRYDTHLVGVHDTTSHSDILATVRATKAQVVILDVDLGANGDGVRLIGPLREAGLKVLALTTDNDRSACGECLHRGAHAVLTPTRTLEGLTTAIDRVSAGQPGMNPVVHHRHLLAFHSSDTSGSRTQARRLVTSLSPREREILGHLMRGATVTEIAADGVVSEATVRTQVKSILIKLEVSTQLAATAVARRAGWQPTQPQSSAA
jgi:two-component system nitrate/nitrite response regulator NarL